MRAVITGPTGAIGIALIQKCLEQKTEVVAICRRHSDRIHRIPKDPMVHIVECDLSELDQLTTEEIGSCDVFFHLGWDATFGSGRNDMSTQIRNVQYTIDAVELAHRLSCRVFVGAGSQAEYGRYEGKLSALTPVFPENGYGMAKLCAGQMSRIQCETYGMIHIWTRILSIYGPCDGERTMILSAIRKLLDGQIPAFTAGEQQWDYLYSKDAAEALYLLSEKGKSGKVYCIGSGSVRPLREYIEILRDAIDPQAELEIGKIPYPEKQVMYLCADISELQADTGFVPHTPFEAGIRETIAWARNEA